MSEMMKDLAIEPVHEPD